MVSTPTHARVVWSGDQDGGDGGNSQIHELVCGHWPGLLQEPGKFGRGRKVEGKATGQQHIASEQGKIQEDLLIQNVQNRTAYLSRITCKLRKVQAVNNRLVSWVISDVGKEWLYQCILQQ